MSSALWCVMNGRAAAPPAMACSVGVSTSQIAAVVEIAADRADDLDALAGAVERAPGCRSGRGSDAAADTPCPACRPTCRGAAPATW